MAAKKTATPYAYKYAAPNNKAYTPVGAMPTKDTVKQDITAKLNAKRVMPSNFDDLSPAEQEKINTQNRAITDKIENVNSKDYVVSDADYYSSPQMQSFLSNPKNANYVANSSAQPAIDFRKNQLTQQYGGIMGADGKPAYTATDINNLASGKYDQNWLKTKQTNLTSALLSDPNYTKDVIDYTGMGGEKGKVYQADLAKLAGDPAALIKAQQANKAAIDAGKKLVGGKTPEQIAADKAAAAKAAAEYKANYKPFTVEKDTGYTKMYGATPNKRLTQSGVETDANVALDRGIASLAKANMPPAAGTVPPAGNAPPVMAPPTLSTVNRLAPNATTGMLPTNTAGIIGLPTTAAPAIPVVTPKPMKKGGIATLPATSKFVEKSRKVPMTGIAKSLGVKMGKK
jgi:hypothetical protein